MLWPSVYTKQQGASKGDHPIFWSAQPQSYHKGLTVTLQEEGKLSNEMAYLFEVLLTVKRQPAKAVWILPNGAKRLYATKPTNKEVSKKLNGKTFTRPVKSVGLHIRRDHEVQGSNVANWIRNMQKQRKISLTCESFAIKTHGKDTGPTFKPAKGAEMPVVFRQFDEHNSSEKAPMRDPNADIEIDVSRCDTFVPYRALLWNAPAPQGHHSPRLCTWVGRSSILGSFAHWNQVLTKGPVKYPFEDVPVACGNFSLGRHVTDGEQWRKAGFAAMINCHSILPDFPVDVASFLSQLGKICDCTFPEDDQDPQLGTDSLESSYPLAYCNRAAATAADALSTFRTNNPALRTFLGALKKFNNACIDASQTTVHILYNAILVAFTGQLRDLRKYIENTLKSASSIGNSSNLSGSESE